MTQITYGGEDSVTSHDIGLRLDETWGDDNGHHGRRRTGLAPEQEAGRGNQGPAQTDSTAVQPARAPVSRLHHYVERTVDSRPDAIALECQGAKLTYRELDTRANRLANHLLATRLKPGARVGIMVKRSVEMYVTLLGVCKAAATYVPIDPATPADRVAYIAGDSGLDLLITTADLVDACAQVESPLLVIDQVADQLAEAPSGRPTIEPQGDPLAYIIYTSGSTGRPKGVEIPQSNICNYVPVTVELYDVTPSERVYQGISLSFDFSTEEIWLPWAVGATVIAGPTDGRQVGSGLADFLEASNITMLHCVPTMLSTLDRLIPSVRTVNMGGEACPPELAERWMEGRRVLNTYGPTEITITCTYAVLRSGKPVTIGKPLPTYTVVLLDEDLRPVPEGEMGEICVGGPGVARGYVNRPDLTAERFVPDPTGQIGGRLYRTGDLGRYNEDGDIEYHGRADSQVQIRGHRVDLEEIESVLLEDEDVTGAVVTVLQTGGTGGELAGYLLLKDPKAADGDLRQRLHQGLRRRVPAYMVPDYLEIVDSFPMMPSGKADRKALPAPTLGRLVGGADQEYVAPATPTEELVASVFSSVLSLPVDTLSVKADLFEDLGGHSLVAATLVSQLRTSEAPAAAELSILDLYSRPTVRGLAEHLDFLTLEQQLFASAAPAPKDRPEPRRWWQRLGLGSGQLAWIYVALLIAMLPIGVVYAINGGAPSWTMLGQIALSLPLTYLTGRWLLPLATARLVGGRIRPGTYPLYSGMHLRVWAVQSAMAFSPLSRLTGSPWASAYLRLAGARIGRHCHIGTAHIPLPSLVRLGEGVTLGYGAHLEGYEIIDGELRIGAVELDDKVVVDANAILQGPASMGAESTLAAQSVLLAGRNAPAGTHWAGSPAQQRDGTGDPVIDLMLDCDAAPQEWPRELRSKFAGAVMVLELLPMLALLPVIALVWTVLLGMGQIPALVATGLSGPLYVVTACALILFVRRFALIRTPVGVHHLRSQLALEKWLADKLLELSLELTNPLYGTLYTPGWLRLLGAKVGRGSEISTIANIDPDLLTIEEGAFVADLASVGPATYANGHVAFRRTEIGRRAFVGNSSYTPSGTHLGDGSLLGVGSVPPVHGVAPGTSWLGSPSIFLPTRQMYDEFTEEATFRPSRGKVAARFVTDFIRVTLPASLLALSTFGTLVTLSPVAAGTPLWVTVLATPVLALLFSLLTVLVVAGIKWVVVGTYRPRVEPLWSGFVRRTEFVTGTYEATAVPALLGALAGTPLLGPLLRLFGTKVGRRALIGSTYLSEFDLVHIGDDVALGPEVSLQTHLFEDRVMKMGRIELGQKVDIGCRAIVLYDTSIGQNVTLGPLSLVMKGESLPPNTRWAGIPSRIAPRTSIEPVDALTSVGKEA